MPIHEHDPWRVQYFAQVACPADVHVPTDDVDAYRWYASHRWIYNKLLIAESQGIDCAPHGIMPTRFPVFSKPIFNLRGMGVGSRTLFTAGDYERHQQPGHMWMSLLSGDHVSSDAALIDGRVRWMRHTVGLPLDGGRFDYWIVEAGCRPELEAYCTRWAADHLQGYTGMLNVETIGGRIIEAHLRFSDQWPDLYGEGWLDALVALYARGDWTFREDARTTGFSVVLFGPGTGTFRHPPAALLESIRAIDGVASVQITFDERRPASAHAMPPGGFRLAVVNARSLQAGLEARAELARHYGLDAAGERPGRSPAPIRGT